MGATTHKRMVSSRTRGPSTFTPHPAAEQPRSRAELYAAGKALRTACPRVAHAAWKAPAKRRDAVDMVLESEKGRLPDLLPLRHGRMVRSAFTFYRGSALTMAADLASTPTSGIRVQCCGDAHLSNFGGFATPERRILFSINDLDETLPAPWEWDVKRLAASFAVASRDNGLGAGAARNAAVTCVRTYRESMAEFSELKTLELWYQAMWAEELVAGIKNPDVRKRAIARMQKERAKSIAQDIFPKLVEPKGDMPVIKDQLPTIFHPESHPPGEIQQAFRDAFAIYRASLPSAYQVLLDRYHLRDAAIKVVGIGSVGTLCWVALFMAGEGDPLFLQIKEARPSVLAPYAGASGFKNQGQRVVHGYRIMQPAGDIFLGWTHGPKRDFFVRQLRDIKISVRVETFGRPEMDLYAAWCGRALALSHARSGSSTMLSGYMGKSDAFDKAIAAFSMAYADQNEKDHDALDRAVRKGTVEAVFEEAEG
jgi:uncharacterized protein (DUF2252 family)